MIDMFAEENNGEREILTRREGDEKSPSLFFHDDCLNVMSKLPLIDIIVTSPPYNLNVQYDNYQDNKEYSEYLVWLELVATKMKECLRDDGSIFLNIGSSNRNPWIAYDVANVFRKQFVLQNNIVWIKSHTTHYKNCGELNFGHYKPINSKRYSNHLFEHVFHFTKSGQVEVDRLSIGVEYTDKSNLKRWKSSIKRRCRGNVWCIPYETIKSRKKDRGNHPATFPPQLAEWAIKFHGLKQGMIVYDPFVGTGSTLVAAYRLGCKGIGSEISKDYIEVAKNRIKEEIN